MIRILMTALLVGALPLADAAAQPDDLRAAIDAYLAEDYSQVDVIAAHAEDGVPEASHVQRTHFRTGAGRADRD